MNKGKFVFSQATSFLPKRAFDCIVARFDGDLYVKHFSCWNQMMCMMYGQLCGLDSLSDLITCIKAHKKKFYHLGFGTNVSKNNLSNSNKKRDYRIFESYFYYLVRESQYTFYTEDQHLDELDGPIYAIDSTVVDLCLSVFWWAEFRRTKAAIKINALFDIKTNIPVFIHVSNACSHDINFLDVISFEMGACYVFDKAYIDYQRLFQIANAGATFVTRIKTNVKFEIIARAKVKKKKGVKSDHTILMTTQRMSKYYPEKLRKIRFYDKEKKKNLIFMTNNFDLKAEDVALLYKYRWTIENFFKWIKQHLKIKSFWGETPNAVKIQIYTALISYLLMATIKRKMKSEYTEYEVIQIIGSSLLDKITLRDLLEKPKSIQDFKEQNVNQLKINFS